MFHSKNLVLIAILGIVVAGSSNYVLILQAWGQRPNPPTDPRNAGDEKQGGPVAKDDRSAPLAKPEETTKIEIFAIEDNPIEGVTRPERLSSRRGEYNPFFDDEAIYAHQKPLFELTSEHVNFCKLKSEVNAIGRNVRHPRRWVVMVDLTNEAQAELRSRIQALNPKSSTRWVFRWGEGRWCMPRSDFTGTRVCVTLDRSAAERVKQSLLKPAKPLAHLRFNDRVRDIAGADSEVILQDAPVNEGTLIGDGKIRKARETGFRVKTPSLNYRSFTVAVRFRLKQAGTGEQPILTCGPQTGWFRARVRNGHLLVNLAGGDRRYGSVEMDAGPVEAGQWYDLVCFARRAELETRIILCGKEVKRQWIPEVGTFAPEPLDVGDRNFRIVPRSIATESLNRPLLNASGSEKEWSFRDPQTGRTFHGQIDEFIVFDRALAIGEAESLRLGEEPRLVEPEEVRPRD